MKTAMTNSRNYLIGLAILVGAGSLINARSAGEGSDPGTLTQATIKVAIKAYPDPFQRELRVSVGPYNRPSITFDLRSLTNGAIVLHETVAYNHTVTLNTANVPTGMYRLYASDERGNIIASKDIKCMQD